MNIISLSSFIVYLGRGYLLVTIQIHAIKTTIVMKLLLPLPLKEH